MSQKTNANTFSVKFVPSKTGGLMAEERVEKRIAFPQRAGKQPQSGETWKVRIAGENPGKTVFFLECIEKDGNGTAAQVMSASPAPVASASAKKTQSKPVSGAEGKGDSMFFADYLFAEGGDPYQQAKSWLTPVTKIDMSNLKFAHAQKQGFADQKAGAIARAMQHDIDLLDAQRAELGSLQAKVKSYKDSDRRAAEELLVAGPRQAAALEAKRQLNLETLAYGRLVQRLNKEGDKAGADLRAAVPRAKQLLDDRRKAVNDECAAAKDAADSAELGRLFGSSEDAVDNCLAAVKEIAALEEAIKVTTAELKESVVAYEDRIHSLRKPS